jgi:hypothetical protein
MSDYSELKRLAEASRVANHDEHGPDEALQEALHPEVVLALIAENEALRNLLKEANVHVPCNYPLRNLINATLYCSAEKP